MRKRQGGTEDLMNQNAASTFVKYPSCPCLGPDRLSVTLQSLHSGKLSVIGIGTDYQISGHVTPLDHADFKR